MAFCRDARSATPTGTLLIEGIGGVMVPLDDRHTVLDWMAALEPAGLLVAGSYLGSLSHTLTVSMRCGGASRQSRRWWSTKRRSSTVPMNDTMATLKRFAEDIPVFGLPRLPARRHRASDVRQHRRAAVTTLLMA